MSELGYPSVAALNHGLNTANKAALQGPLTGGNPRVGAVLIAADGQIKAVGYHRGAHTAHAEIDCLNQVPKDEDLSCDTLIVTLEPCSHCGKTGPCTEVIVQRGVGVVIYAVHDPNPLAAGGADFLRSQGVRVQTAEEVGIAPQYVDAAQELSHCWRVAVTRERPWTVGKIAQTIDGYVAALDGTSQWISSPYSRAHSHRIRAQQDVIVVGTGTVLADNPALTARMPSGELLAHQPRKVVIGKRDIPADFKVFDDPRTVCEKHHDLKLLLENIYRQGDRMALIEGGPTLLTAALKLGLLDELHVYIAPKILGAGKKSVDDLGIGTLAEAITARALESQKLGPDTFICLRDLNQGRE